MNEKICLTNLSEEVYKNLSAVNELIELVDLYIEGDRKIYQLIQIISQKIKLSLNNMEKIRNLIYEEDD